MTKYHPGLKIKQLRNKHKETQEFLRKQVIGHGSTGTMSGAEHGRFHLEPAKLSKLENHWNLPPGFLMDERNFTDKEITLMQRFVNIISDKKHSKHLKSIEDLINLDPAGKPSLRSPSKSSKK